MAAHEPPLCVSLDVIISEAADTITLCDAAQACEYLSRGSPPPEGEISTQGLAT